MRRSHAIAVVLTGMTLLAFCRACNNQFVTWDDEPLIYRNPHLNPPTVAGLAWHWAHPHWDMYIPVVYTAWWSVAHLDGAVDPLWFHAANILVHLGSVYLVFFIIRRLIGADWPAALGALLFAVHPLMAEPVVWATGMKDLLSAFLALSAIWFYLRFTTSRFFPAYVAATLFFLAALLAKPSTVTVPAIAAVLEIGILGGRWRRSLKWLAPWLIPAAAICLVAVKVQSPPDLPPVPILARPLIAADATAFYLWKLIWPVHLGLDYGRTPAAVLHGGFSRWTWLAPLTIAVILLARRNRALIAAGLVFVLALLPVLGLWPFIFQTYSTVADRYAYLAMLGPALAMAWFLKAHSGRASIFGAWVLLAAFVVLSIEQAGYWHDSQSLYRHAIAVNGKSSSSHNNLGVVLMDQGDMSGAVAQFKIVVQLRPQQIPAYRYIADATGAMGDWRAAADWAGRLLDEASQQHQDMEELHQWRGGICVRWGDASAIHRQPDARTAYEQAVKEYEEALKLNPNDAVSRQNLWEAESGLQALRH